MIHNFKHKGLKRLFQDDDPKGVKPDQVERIQNILGILSIAEKLDDIDLPSLKLHRLKGSLKSFYAVTVRANWRIIFRFGDGNCYDVDLVEYH